MKILFSIVVLSLILFLVHTAEAQTEEMAMKTESGEIVLTIQPCTIKDLDFQYYGYATEVNHANHEGCWRVSSLDGMGSIELYFPEINATAVYNPKLFKKRASI